MLTLGTQIYSANIKMKDDIARDFRTILNKKSDHQGGKSTRMGTLDLMDQRIRATDKMTLLRHIQTYRIEISDDVHASSVVSYSSSGGSGTHAGGGGSLTSNGTQKNHSYHSIFTQSGLKT